MMASERVSVVIPVYNQLAYTKQCLESIRRQSDQPGEIIVVDNASTDGTKAFLEEAKVRLITNHSNLGCATAWNQGAQASRGEVVGILNNDVVVTPGWLKNLLVFLEGSGHGIISPAAREGPLNYDLDRYAAEFTRRCARATRSEVYGACLFIRREVFDTIGLFDEGFRYGGCEDIDFIWRARRAGYTIGMTGSVLIHHFGMLTQDAVKQTVTRAYPDSNLAHFQKKWNRTVRGNWAERRWSGFKASLQHRYERLRYGHTLVEKGC